MGPHYQLEIEWGRRIFGHENPHPDDYGHRVTAQVVYEYLTRHGYVRNSSTNLSERYHQKRSTCPG